jgi:hypothetical protein
MRFSEYFIHNRKRPDRQVIREEWIERVVRGDTVHNAFFDRRFKEDQDAG